MIRTLGAPFFFLIGGLGFDSGSGLLLDCGSVTSCHLVFVATTSDGGIPETQPLLTPGAEVEANLAGESDEVK